MKAVIFAGGTGKRLWPLSRKKSPKQFIKIINNQTMLQVCVRRLYPQFTPQDIFVSTGKRYKSDVRHQLPEIPFSNILMEPEMRDVGPAVGLVTAIMLKRFPDEPMSILWGDHLVKNDKAFRKILKNTEEIIRNDPNKIVFIAQKPRFASQNLGWIEYGEKVEVVDLVDTYSFKSFKYQPDEKTALSFFKSENHTWNIGYFVTTPKFLWEQYRQFCPDLFKKLEKIYDACDTEQFEDVLNSIYPTIEKISFDNAILEKLDPKSAYVISEDLGWSDIGAWEALKEALETSRESNVTSGSVLLEDSEDSLVYNYEDGKTIVGIDLEDHLIVNTRDVLLITKKTSVPKIKTFVESLKDGPHEDLT